MEITTDVILKGNIWKELTEKLRNIFKTNWEVYELCTGIGIMYDKQYEFEMSKDESQISIPRTLLQRYSQLLDIMFQSAILSTCNVEYNEQERLNLAFDDEKAIEFNKMQFLTKFANYGAIELEKLLGIDDVETMENIKTFLTSSVEGHNYDIDPIAEKLNKMEIDKTDINI